MKRKLRRVIEKKWIGGVCAGVAYAAGFPTWMIRLAWTVSICFGGLTVLLYVLLWIFMPKWDFAPPDYDEITGA